ncbi:uncharacterized protein LOC122364460 [Amphibalanus amphitrite]|uniref:uncharacterized protein LOC122364460 n=1 Tax=Amphibalanus amphitrite TaxID=1232801 RepID=UPI001C912393|nr:uncharacterized protein LOC122364460 [Amphibalanus amphitrite]
MDEAVYHSAPSRVVGRTLHRASCRKHLEHRPAARAKQKMRLSPLLVIVAATLGEAWAGACGEQQYGRLPPLLVTTAETPTVYAWPEQKVELHCRPSQAGGCRWLKGSRELGTECRLSTTERGTIRCVRGEETCGTVTIKNPNNQAVEHTYKSYHQRNSYHYRRSHQYWDYKGETRWNRKPSTFLCSRSGTIILKSKVCDGIRKCSKGEDEWHCSPPCGPPYVSENTKLSDPKEEYPDGSHATYICENGFSLAESLSGLRRTCRAGRWDGAAPVCRRNIALGQPITVTGLPMADCKVAVDGSLDTWCMLAPSNGPKVLAVRLVTNVTVERVLVRAMGTRYTVALRPVNQTNNEVDCPCQELSSDKITLSVSGVRVCVCPEQASTVGQLEVRVSAETGAFLALSVADVVALGRSDDDNGDACALLGQPAHGRYEPAQTGTVKLSCDPGYTPSCSDSVRCSDLQSGTARLSCLAAECPSPPAIPNTKTGPKNGTGWRSVVEYSCAAGYALYPSEQNTTSTCDSDSLWSLGHISCVSETDIRVVAMRLGEQHERSMAALRAELETPLMNLLADQKSTEQRLSKLELSMAAQRAELETLLKGQLADQNSTQQRLNKLEREVARLGLAAGAYLPAQERDPTEDATEPAPEEEGVTQTPEAGIDRAVVTSPEQQSDGAADSEELGEGTAETTPPSDVELIPWIY